MFEIPIERLTEADIQQLVDSHTLESQYLDFKETLPNLLIDKSKSTMCGDIAAFANASGGDLIYGISEEQSDTQDIMCALGIPGVDVEDADKLIRQITEIVQRGIEPRGLAVRVRVIGFSDGRRVVVVRVPESFRKPLRVIGTNYWYVRVNNQNSHMQYNQIQDLFLNSERLSKRLRDFRDERLSAILSNDSIAPFECGRLIVYHFMPKVAFEGEFEADLDAYWNLSLPRCNRIDGSKRTTMDGIAFFGMAAGYTDMLLSKTEIFHTGVIEMVDAHTLHNASEMNRSVTEDMIGYSIQQGIAGMKQIKVTCRISFFLTILNIGGMRLWSDPSDFRPKEYRVSRRNLEFPEYILEPGQAIEPMINATLRRLRNAFGM
ncbi:MAG: ATP-binding protein [Planctomycetaceae bacterium]|nr:ATP-binding protein [Planctomycetaceae bacterium]